MTITMKHMTPKAMLVILAAIAMTGMVQAQTPSSPRLYEPAEWTYNNPTPPTDKFGLEANATFTHTATSTQIQTQMYYAGGTSNNWILRFTGTLPGTWTFVTSCSDPDLNGKTGSVTVQATPRGKGFITKCDDGKRWAWSHEMEAFVPQCVQGHQPNTIYSNPSVVDSHIATFFGEHGFNGYHTYVLCRWFDINKDSYDDFSTTTPEPDPRTFEALETLINKVYEAGGMTHIWAWGDEQRKMTPIGFSGGINGTVDQRLQRYICARLGPLPGWTMGYGWDLQEWVTTSQMQTWHYYMRSRLGWEHFLGARSPDMTQIYYPASGYRDHWFSSYQQHRPTYDMYVQAYETLHPGVPSFMTDRFRCRQNVYPDKDYTPEMTRRGLYHSTMAGGVGNIWAYLIPIPPDDVSLPYPNKEQLLAYAKFFEGRFQQGMVRDNALTNGVCLRKSNTLYIFYKEDTTSISMNLSGMAGSRPAVAMDTKLAYAPFSIGMLSPTSQTWTAPYSSDWVIAIDPPTLPAPPIIAEVTPDPDTAMVGQAYTKQLTLLQGLPYPSWSVITGPTGLQVSETGLVSGWTPIGAQTGQLFTITIRATNSEGSDNETWQTLVRLKQDFDQDGDVDLIDFGFLQRCYSGSGVAPTSGCEDADLDGDNDVDQTDFNAFKNCFGGADRPPGC